MKSKNEGRRQNIKYAAAAAGAARLLFDTSPESRVQCWETRPTATLWARSCDARRTSSISLRLPPQQQLLFQQYNLLLKPFILRLV